MYTFIRGEWMIAFDNSNWYITKNDARHWMGNIKEYKLDDVAKIARELMFIVEQVARNNEPNRPQNVSVGIYPHGNTIQVWCAKFSLRGEFRDEGEALNRITETLKQVDFGRFRKE
jgi:hypothetical protein